MKKKILMLGAITMLYLSGCNEKAVDNRAETTTTEIGRCIDYEITYTDTTGWVNIIGQTEVQVVAEIENTGTVDLYMSAPKCELEDKDGNLVDVVSLIYACPSVIKPNEKAYVYGVVTMDNYPGDNELNVVLKPELEELKFQEVVHEVSDVSLSEDSYGDIYVQGRITNTSNEVQSMNYIEVVLFDENHIPIGYDYEIISDIQPNEEIGFKVGLSIPDFATLEDVKDYLIYAHPMQVQY